MTTAFSAQKLPKIAQFTHFSPDSKIWIYPCSRQLTPAEHDFVEKALLQFCKNWTAHHQQLQATAEIFEYRMAILMVDETKAGASGCSIDKSVHFLEELGARLHVDFFDRMTFGWKNEGSNIKFGNLQDFKQAVETGEIQSNTLVVNTLVKNLGEVASQFWMPFSESWHRRLV